MPSPKRARSPLMETPACCLRPVACCLVTLINPHLSGRGSICDRANLTRPRGSHAVLFGDGRAQMGPHRQHQLRSRLADYKVPTAVVVPLRDRGAGRVLLKAEFGAGHRGPSGRHSVWRDEAFVFAFLLQAAR